MNAKGRNLLLIGIAAGLCSMGWGCEPTKPAADANVKFQGAAGSTKAGDADLAMPDIPKDAQFTIVCKTYQGDSHVQISRQVQQALLDSTQMKKWYIIHASDHSTLYYGFYRTIDPRDPKDGAEGRRALDDLNAIRSMTDTQGQRLFSEALPMTIDAPDPQANPAWDITRTKGMWSIEIASYTLATRKQDAVDSVREMRKNGIEAYYYHGSTASSVCIGCWPANAAIRVAAADQNVDPNMPVVATNQPLAPSIADPLAKQGIQSISDHVEIQDPTLIGTMSKYPDHATNGMTRMLGQVSQEKSFLFEIPHPDPLDTMSNTATADTGTPSPLQQQAEPAPKPVDPAVGRLKSFGE